MPFVTSSFLLPVVRPGATSSVLAPMVFVPSSFFLPVVRPGATSSVLAPLSDGLTTGNKKLLVTKGIATSSKDATSGSRPYYW